jgi:dolichyl-phosphate-mannose-protein mannosyltransferase
VPQPVATIGGEPDGRGAIVVEDNLGQNPNVPPQGEETHVDAGKAEPGRDIFAAPPQAGVMSEEKPNPPPVEGNEPKAVSAVGVSSGEAVPNQDESAPEKPEGRATTAPLGDSSPLAPPSDNTPPAAAGAAPVGAEGAKAKVQGPVDAEQAEADEVRQELFPDAVA